MQALSAPRRGRWAYAAAAGQSQPSAVPTALTARVRRQLLCRAAAAAEHSSPLSAPQFSAGSVLRLKSACGKDLWAEVVSAASGSSLVVASEGGSYALAQKEDGAVVWSWALQGPLLTPSDPAVRALQGWQSYLPGLPAPTPYELDPSSEPQLVTSLQDLSAEVQADAKPWCDGTGPGDAPLTEQQSAMLTAGEVLSLVHGKRGIAMVQVYVGWDAKAPQPVYRPLALSAMRTALATPGIRMLSIPTPGDAKLGLTALLYADKEPWASWAAHLASFGCQASVEAQSSYYKLLIGTMLGYKHEHIVHHIKTRDGPGQPSPAVVAAVEAQLTKLSKKKAALPWNVTTKGSRGKKASAK